jgi:Cu/Ag efflux pump CusA
MGTLPFALTGGIWMLYLLGYAQSVATGVGFIALAGVGGVRRRDADLSQARARRSRA